MSKAAIGLCTLELHLAGVGSLKEKRRILKSLLARLHNTFNVTAAETDYQDLWQSAQIAIATVSNSNRLNNQVLDKIITWIENHYPDAMIIQHEIELL